VPASDARAPSSSLSDVRVSRVKPAVFYLRMAPQLRDALAARAVESGVSLNAWAVNALAAAAGPDFLAAPSRGGAARTLIEAEQATRPDAEGMRRIAAEYRSYWINRLGPEHARRISTEARDGDRVWAWWVGHRREQQELTAMGLTR